MVSIDSIDTVTVLGAGSMGHGIAELAAIAGYDVVLRDIEEEYVQDGYENIEWSVGKLAEKNQISEDSDTVLARIETETDLEASVADADFVIEAIPEDLELKQDTFATVDDVTHDDAILATNTSSLRVSDIAAKTSQPEQCCGLHFFNPPVKMDLVEVVRGDETSDEVFDTAYEFAKSIDKTPIRVKKDVPEFVVNNVLVPFMEEGAWILDEGEETIESIDAAAVYQRGYPMGPFELNDFGGLDIFVHTRDQQDIPVPESVRERFDNDNLGKKTGSGFYEYTDGPGVDYHPSDAGDVDTLRIDARMVNEAAKLVGEDVARPEDIDVGMRLGGGLPEGTCRRGDKIGLDRVLEKMRALHEETGAKRYEPAEFLETAVENGNLGEKSGKGFYDYSGDGPYFYTEHTLDDNGVLQITLDRLERLNAFNDDMFSEVETILKTADLDEVRCVVFEGAGGAFSAGADITAFTADEPIEIAEVDQMIKTVDEFKRPTVAKIDGHCLGAGLELATACDFRIATEGSTLGSPEANLGIIPGGGATQRLQRQIGALRTKELIMRGKHIDPATAVEWNLINEAASEDEIDDVVDEYVTDLADGPPVALSLAKEVIREGQDASLETGLSLEGKAHGMTMTTEDMIEGVAAFRQDRDPEFEGK